MKINHFLGATGNQVWLSAPDPVACGGLFFKNSK
jgi:hypothetical protein